MSADKKTGGLAGVVAQGSGIVLGGELGNVLFADVNRYDPVSDSWSSLPNLPTARHGLAAAVVGGDLYAIAGSTLASRVQNTPIVEILTKEALAGSTR